MIICVTNSPSISSYSMSKDFKMILYLCIYEVAGDHDLQWFMTE